MSWSVNAIGKANALAPKLAGDFERINYLQQTEAELKDMAASLVAKVLAANTRKDQVLKIDCSGSGSSHPADGDSQQVKILIEPIYGFVG